MLTTPGFTNTGPAVGQDHVYFGLRWEGSTSSTHGSGASNYGRLVAVNKADWSVAWTRALVPEEGAPAWPRSWINVTPLVWESAADPARQVILVGDAGGSISAWDKAGEREPLFLTDGLAPLRCDEIESTDPGYSPRFVRSNRTQVTPTPHATYGADAWHNTQGAATEMSVYGGRLFAGYNNAHPHEADSSLVIFRNATNLSAGALTVEVIGENGHAAPVTRETALRPGQQVRVSVPLYLEGDPLGGPKQVPLAVGWTSREPQVRTVAVEPFQQHTEQFTLTVPDPALGLGIMAVANPALYGARREHEAVQSQLPPGVETAPAALPASWQAGWEPPRLGEVWVLDNARTWLQPYQCDLSIRIDAPAPGAEVQRGEFDAVVTVTRHGCGGQQSAQVMVDDITQRAAFGDTAQQATLTFPVVAHDCGSFTLTAEVDPQNRNSELDETNNQAERIVSVGGCTQIETQCPPHVSPEKCRGSKPTS